MRRRLAILTIAACTLSGLIFAAASAQPSPLPVYAITGARIYIGNGTVIDKGTVVIREGLVWQVGEQVEVPFDATVIEGEGLTLYPGFIDAQTTVGLKPPDPRPDQDTPPDLSRSAMARTREANRKGIRPELLAAQWFDLNEDGGKAHRQVGFTTALVAPAGGALAGQSCLVNLNGLPRRFVVLKSPVALHGAFRIRGRGYPTTLMGILAHLRQTFLDAQRYQQHLRAFERRHTVRRPPHDEVLAALAPVLRGEEPLIFAANSENDIRRVLALAEEFGLRVIISGATEGWKVTDQLVAARVPVILSLDFGKEPSDPDAEDEAAKETPPDPDAEGEAAKETPPDAPDAKAEEVEEPAESPDLLPYRVRKDRRERWEERVANAAALHQAGVRFALTTAGLSPSEFFKNLEKAIAAGVPREVALTALTQQPAELFGVQRMLGSIERGKLANLVAFTGAFGDDDAQVRYVFIEGKQFEFEVKPEKPSRQPPAEGVDLSGEWELTIESPEGEQTATFVLKQTPDGNLTGEMRSQFGIAPITSGSISGQKLQLTVEFTIEDQTFELEISGEVKGDTMNGTYTMPFGEGEWHAKRKPSAASEGMNR